MYSLKFTLLFLICFVLSVFTFNVNAELKFSGRIQLDYDNTKTHSLSDSSLEYRRVWANVSKKTEDWKYTARFDLRAHEFENDAIIDMVATYSGFDNSMKVILGRQKTQFGLNWITSNSKMNFAERASVVELHRLGRMDGITLLGNINSQLNYWIGLYRKDDFSGTAKIARLTYSKQMSNEHHIHFGSGAVFTNLRNTLNLEAAYGNGPFQMQTEYFKTYQTNDSTSETNGYYIETSYFLGDSNFRSYKRGIYSGVNPNSSTGSWQVVVRYESGDGNYSDIGLKKIDGRLYGIGLNWYWNPSTTFYLSHMNGKSLDTNEKGKETRLRIQYMF